MLDRPTIVRLSEVLAIACAMFGQPVVCTAYIYILRMLVTYMMEWRPCFFFRRQHSFTDSDTSFVGSNTQRRICSLHWLDKQQVKMLWIRIQSISFQRRGKGWKRFIAGYCYFLLFFTFFYQLFFSLPFVEYFIFYWCFVFSYNSWYWCDLLLKLLPLLFSSLHRHHHYHRLYRNHWY